MVICGGGRAQDEQFVHILDTTNRLIEHEVVAFLFLLLPVLVGDSRSCPRI